MNKYVRSCRVDCIFISFRLFHYIVPKLRNKGVGVNYLQVSNFFLPLHQQRTRAWLYKGCSASVRHKFRIKLLKMKKGEKKDLAKLAEARAEVQVRVLYIGLLSPHGKGWGGGVRHKICERERKKTLAYWQAMLNDMDSCIQSSGCDSSLVWDLRLFVKMDLYISVNIWQSKIMSDACYRTPFFALLRHTWRICQSHVSIRRTFPHFMSVNHLLSYNTVSLAFYVKKIAN